jgi:hypothetical protein
MPKSRRKTAAKTAVIVRRVDSEKSNYVAALI